MATLRIAATLFAACALLPVEAQASELIARNAANVKLQVSRNGQTALLSYRAQGRTWYVLASGAINAIAPTPNRRQVSFRLRRSTTRPRFQGACPRLRVDRVKVTSQVAACTAGGSNWVVQAWQRALPNFGVAPSAARAQTELRLSHWSGPLAVLTLRADWSHGGKWQHIYGNLYYRQKPVHGFGSSRFGAPTDSFGRNIYLDTLDSAYGTGWRREISFLTHIASGAFCYDLTPHRAGLTGAGTQYRAMVIGPGVTPDVAAVTNAPGPYSAAKDAAANQEQASIFVDDSLCRAS
jgi:hypothetical protein